MTGDPAEIRARIANRHGQQDASPADDRNRPCLFLGEVLDKRGSNCASCWIRGCGLHGKCVTGRDVDGLPMCRTCEDYEAED